MTDNFRDNPNPEAKIGFIIFYPFQFYVYKNVYRHLAQKSEFIIDSGRFYTLPQPKEAVDKITSLLIKKGSYFRTLNFEDYFNTRRIRSFFSSYEVLVSLWQSGAIMHPYNQKKKKVHLNYGAGKELTIFDPYHRKWDIYLCLSYKIQQIIRLYTRAEVVGYPKFDDWFNKTVNVPEPGLHIAPDKKTLLYLPTHGDLSSIDILANELKKISNKYNIIVKLHYYTSYVEPRRKKLLQHKNICVLNDDSDLLPLLKIADLVISDNSSAILEAILADRPVVATNFLTKDYLDKTHRRLKLYPFRPIEGALTYSQSIEQRIKNEGSIISFDKPSELAHAIEVGLTDGNFFAMERKKIKEETFAFNDGRCGKRAADAIEKLLFEKTFPEKPILYHVFENYENKLNYQLDLTGSPSLSIPQNKKKIIYMHTKTGRNILIKMGLKMMEIKRLSFFQKVLAIAKEFFS